MDGQASHVGWTCCMVNRIHGLSIYQSTAFAGGQAIRWSISITLYNLCEGPRGRMEHRKEMDYRWTDKGLRRRMLWKYQADKV